LKAREKGYTATVKECAAGWKNVKQSVKEEYESYAEEIKEERSRNRDLYEIAFGVKPKRPRGPYNFFLMDLAKEGKFTGFKEASKIWNNKSDKDKEKYLKAAKKAQLAYMIKKAEFKSTARKAYSKPKSAFNLFIADMSGKTDDKTEDDSFFNYCYNKWKIAEESVKRKYKKKAEELAQQHDERKEELKSRVFDMPKRPQTGYNRYTAERLPILKEKSPAKAITEFFKIIGSEWKGMKKIAKEKYNKLHENDLEAYKEKIKKFKLNGYYTPAIPDTGKKSVSKRSSSIGADSKKGKAI
jgi:hypothetical protein